MLTHEKEMIDVIIPFKRTFRSLYNSWGTFLQVVTEKWLLFIIIWEIFVVTTINVHGAGHFTFLGVTYKSFNFDGIFSAKLECNYGYLVLLYYYLLHIYMKIKNYGGSF